MSGAFEAYAARLRAALLGKDASRLPKRLRGAIAFVFRGDAERRGRLTLRFAEGGVGVDNGTRLSEGEPTAYVMCALDDWLAFYEHADAGALDAIDIYGDAKLLEALPLLTAQRRSPLHARLRGA